MATTFIRLILLLTLWGSTFLAADAAFTLCKDNTCGQCPVTLASAGSGYLNCVIYNSKDVFANQGYPGSDDGGWRPYLDIPDQKDGCYTIVKSPADTTRVGCGVIIASFNSVVCAVLNLDKSFMLETCCGTDQCRTAGATKRSAKTGHILSDDKYTSGNILGLLLQHSNGTLIQPAQTGSPLETTTRKEHSMGYMPYLANKKRSGCDKNSWVPDAGQADYTKPADGTQIVLWGQIGPGTATIAVERSQSWTTTLSASIGFEDVLSLGVSFEQSFTKSITETKAHDFTVLEGQTGDVGFTPHLRCSTGRGRCNGADVHGEVCTPFSEAGELAGTYAFISRG